MYNSYMFCNRQCIKFGQIRLCVINTATCYFTQH